MTTTQSLNDTWIKASILGTTWAASEIVLGSFLHNLRIPFSGNILTAIGLIILISVSYKWRIKGLFWRAGLICAILKTLSPSAVIFGPMIAIFSQSVLLEIFVRIFGRSFIGFGLGGIIAMSWNLFQKIINYIIFYGYNIVDVYKNVLIYAKKQFNFNIDLIWHPILILFALYGIFGLIAAIIGMKMGKSLLNKNLELKLEKTRTAKHLLPDRSNENFNYSLYFLLLNICLMVGGLFSINLLPWYFGSILIISIILFWITRYKRALRQLSKSKFWVYFFLITMIVAFVVTKIQSKTIADGLIIGLQMNFRAALMIIGFSVLGTELYNPVIREFFLKSSIKQLPLALKIALNTLPNTLTSIPNFKEIIKSPALVLHQVISLSEIELIKNKNIDSLSQQIFILTGSIGQGKTTYLQKLIDFFKSKDIQIGGIYSPRVVENETTIGYDIIDINTNNREIFLREGESLKEPRIGRFNINLKGLQKGVKALKKTESSNAKIVIIDEVGLLELQNKGWANNIHELVSNSQNHILLVIRDSFVEKVIEKWNLKNYKVFDIAKNDINFTSSIIQDKIN